MTQAGAAGDPEAVASHVERGRAKPSASAEAVAVYLLLVLILVVVCWPAWIQTDHLVSGGDAIAIHYPWFVLWRDTLALGDFPLWNPYSFSGIPAFPTLQAGYGYPLHWLLTPAPPILAMNWLVGGHVVLAGVGAAWCAGRLGAPAEGRLLAGLAYALGSAMTARIWSGHFSFVETNAWLPLATGLAIGIGQRHAVSLLALTVGMLVLAGQPEVLIFSLWWLPAWAIGAALIRGNRRPYREILRVLLGLGLGLGVAAFQLLPVLDMLAVSNRQTSPMSWDFRTGASLPPWHLLTVFGPLLFGGPADSTYWPGPSYEWHERLLWVGTVPLLALCGLRGRWRVLCWSAFGVAVALAFGRYNPLYLLTQWLPGYDTLRIPSKHLTLAALVLAVGAGCGLPYLHGRRAAVSALGLAVAVLTLAATMDRWLPVALILSGRDALQLDLPSIAASSLALSGAVPGVVALIVAAGLLLVRRDHLRQRLLLALAATELVLALHPFRSGTVDPLRIVEDARLPAGYDSVGLLGSPDGIIGNHGPVARVRLPSGYVSLYSAGYMTLLTGGANAGVVLTAPADSTRVLYLLGYPVLLNRDERQLITFDQAPREVWVARCAWEGDARDVRRPDFPLTSCVTHRSATGRATVEDSGPAEVLARANGALTVRAAGPGWLVTTLPWYPGWSATADGRALNVDVVDGALVGVELPEGESIVHLRYWPSSLSAGIVVSVTTLGLLVVAWLADWKSAHPGRVRLSDRP